MRTIALALCLLAATAATAADLTPDLNLRLRQEVLEGVYHFAPDADRNWLRLRARAGLRLGLEQHAFAFRLLNESRHHLAPDPGVDWDELLLDRALWTWQVSDRNQLIVGRQAVIWDDGFLMLEGHPLDGSRSIYHDAVRFRRACEGGSLDLVLMADGKRDDLVLSGDENRPLSDADERGVALRLARGSWSGTAIWKDEDDPDGVLSDLRTLTFGLRYTHRPDVGVSWHAEAAVQHQDGPVPSASECGEIPDDGWAVAGQAFATGGVGRGFELEGGGFLYSGGGCAGGNLRPFRTPWGRWPRWSEMYIYTLIGEGTPGRVHVAAWENIAAPRLNLRRPLNDALTARLGLNWLMAPANDWETRGLLTQLELKARFGGGATGHLLWEMLDPGSYHDGRYGLPALTDTIHFLRWQIAWSL
ncbi:MAG: hypothetical protein GY838_12130 [bacterium]|nr:hypothetical protein [bacterium]